MSTNVLSNSGASSPPIQFTEGSSRLLDLADTLREVFGDNPPSVRWFQYQTKRGIIPKFKIGGMVRYDPRLVRAALDLHCLVQGKKNRNARNAA